jgi:hypothetical protein
MIIREKQLRDVSYILSYLSEQGAEARLNKLPSGMRLAGTDGRYCRVRIDGRIGALTKTWTVGPRGGIAKNEWAARD